MGNEKKEERNAAIVAKRNAGKKYAEIANEHGISIARARQIVEREKRRLRLEAIREETKRERERVDKEKEHIGQVRIITGRNVSEDVYADADMVLSLSNRLFLRLMRSRIYSKEQLIDLLNDEKGAGIRNIGKVGIEELEKYVGFKISDSIIEDRRLGKIHVLKKVEV